MRRPSCDGLLRMRMEQRQDFHGALVERAAIAAEMLADVLHARVAHRRQFLDQCEAPRVRRSDGAAAARTDRRRGRDG